MPPYWMRVQDLLVKHNVLHVVITELITIMNKYHFNESIFSLHFARVNE